MSDHDERDDLESLLAHRGWIRFAAHAVEHYDRHFLDQMETLLDNGSMSPEETRDRARQAAAVRKAVRGLLEWPRRRAQTLSAQT